MNPSKRSLLVAAALLSGPLAVVATTTAVSATTTTAPPTTTDCGGPKATPAPAKPAAGGSTTSTAAPASPASTAAAGGDQAPASAEIDGSGATFPKVFYQEMIAAYTEKNPGVTITYGGGGSGKGRQDLADQIVQWAGTDGVIKDADKGKFQGGEVLYFPTVVAPITVAFNLDGIDSLKLSPATIAKIFQREITNWNDPAIAADNADLKLPDQPITVARRSDSSGTTGNFTKFLEKSEGKDNGCVWKLGTDSTIEWPKDTQAGEGNNGVAQIVQSTPGAIGYVDLSDAVDAKLTFADVQNKAGKFVKADANGAAAAAAGAKVADDLTYSAIWADGDGAYPITAQTWIIVYQKQTDKAQGEAIKSFLQYVLTDGQLAAIDLNFAPLPEELAKRALAHLNDLQIG